MITSASPPPTIVSTSPPPEMISAPAPPNPNPLNQVCVIESIILNAFLSASSGLASPVYKANTACCNAVNIVDCNKP